MKIELKVQSVQMTEVLLTLSPIEKTALAQKLANLDPTDETKVQDSGVTLYFKLKATDSRVLIARPELEEWVVTVSLESQYMKVLIQKLNESQGFKLSSFCPANRVNNASLTVT